MNKGKFFGAVFCILMAVLIFGIGFVDKENNKNTVTLFQVYLNGKKIGLIESDQELYDLIDSEQAALKEKYNVSKVYPPHGLKVTAVKTYDKRVTDVKTIYNKIKNDAPFTIKGYQITINDEEDGNKSFYILNKDDLDVAVKNTVLSFVPKDKLNSYLEGTQPEITDVGETLDNVYLKQEVKIKEALISTEETIFTNSEDLSRYMLFGTLESEKQYEIKKGDDVKSVATNNMLSVNEFLIANPQIVSENALLSVGQKVNISLINPLVDVISETTTVEKQEIKYETTVEYDNSLSSYTRYVKQEGSNGLVKVTYKNEIINGLLNNAVTVSTEEIAPTINRILVVGGINTVYVGDSTYWAWPTNKPYRISSIFGPRWGSWHYGIDITGTGHGSPIYSIQNGTVFRTGTRSDMGNFVMITHNNGYNSVYMHLSKILVKTGDTVVKGQTIGLMGTTGRSTGTHLHLGVWTGSTTYSNARMIDPLTLYK